MKNSPHDTGPLKLLDATSASGTRSQVGYEVQNHGRRAPWERARWMASLRRAMPAQRRRPIFRDSFPSCTWECPVREVPLRQRTSVRSTASGNRAFPSATWERGATEVRNHGRRAQRERARWMASLRRAMPAQRRGPIFIGVALRARGSHGAAERRHPPALATRFRCVTSFPRRFTPN